MTILASVIVLTLLTSGFIMLYTATKPEPEDPAGFTIEYTEGFGWHYTPHDSQMMWGGKYLTRRSAVRAAKAEQKRIEGKTQ